MGDIPVQAVPPSLGTIRRQVFTLALPAVGEQLLNTIVGLTDVYLVGNLSPQAAVKLGYGSATALASTGLANQMVWLMTVLFMAFAIGSTALIARAHGANDQDGVQRIAQQSMLVGLGIGVLAMVLTFVLARPFLLALGTADDVVPHSEQYLLTLAPALIPAALVVIGSACLRGVGDTRTPLYIMFVVNGLNVFVSWVLINGHLGLPALGVNGAALGTAIGRGTGGMLIIGLLLRGQSGVRLRLHLRAEVTVINRIARIGIPSAGEMLVFHGALLVFTRLVNSISTVAYAAHSVTITIESLSFLPGMGYAAATSTLVGQALGARAPRYAEDCAYEALWQGGWMMSLAGLLMVGFPEQLLALFTNDLSVIAAGVVPLRTAGLVQPALAVGFILSGGLRGAGDTSWPLYSRLMTTWGVRLPLALILVVYAGFGLGGIWLAMCTDFTVQALLALWRFNSGRWQQIQV